MARYRSEVAKLMSIAKSPTNTDNKTYTTHLEMFYLKEAGAKVLRKNSLSKNHFEAELDGKTFIHVCNDICAREQDLVEGEEDG